MSAARRRRDRGTPRLSSRRMGSSPAWGAEADHYFSGWSRGSRWSRRRRRRGGAGLCRGQREDAGLASRREDGKTHLSACSLRGGRTKTNRSGLRYTPYLADEIFVRSVVVYRRRWPSVSYRDPLSVEDLLGTLRRGRCFRVKRWKVPRCRPSRAAQLARPPRVVARLAPPDALAARALVGSFLGGRLPEEEGRGNKERRPRRPSPAPGRAAATSAAREASASVQSGNTASHRVVGEAREQERDTAMDKGRDEPVKEGRGKIKRKKKAKRKMGKEK
jgi:hypothetical protein